MVILNTRIFRPDEYKGVFIFCKSRLRRNVRQLLPSNGAKLRCVNIFTNALASNSLAVLSKAQVYSLAGIAGSNPAANMDVSLS